MEHRKITAAMLGEAFDDLSDGDGDNRRAASLLMELQTLNVYEHDVEARLYDGDLAGAETSCDLYLLKKDKS